MATPEKAKVFLHRLFRHHFTGPGCTHLAVRPSLQMSALAHRARLGWFAEKCERNSARSSRLKKSQQIY